VTRVYLTGPMTGCLDFNRAGFAAGKAYATGQGWTAVSPQTTDPSHDGPCPDGERHTTAAGSHPYSCWIKASLRLLLSCDAVLMLPGWPGSRGARLERSVAELCDMPVHDMKQVAL
jgi:hypothetical protein